MARVGLVLVKEVGGNFQPVKGATVKMYEYDSGQPNNRGSLIGTLSENPSNSGQYVIDITTTKKVVITANDGGGEANIAAWDGRKVWGDTITTAEMAANIVNTANIVNNAITTDKIADEAVTPSKTTFAKDW